MTVVSTAEAAYWNLHLAQEQMRFFEESVKLAETLVKDGKTRAQPGWVQNWKCCNPEGGIGPAQIEAWRSASKCTKRSRSCGIWPALIPAAILPLKSNSSTPPHRHGGSELPGQRPESPVVEPGLYHPS